MEKTSLILTIKRGENKMKKLNLVLITLAILLAISLSAFAVIAPANVGPTTNFNGDVNIPSGFGYYINGSPLSSGEANTASNIGASGIGVYKQKTIVDLEFKKLYPMSNKIIIIDGGEAEYLYLRPNGAGNETSISQAVPAVAHYLNVDDETPDGAGTYVYQGATDVVVDSYALPNHTTESGTINGVTVYMVVRENEPGYPQCTARTVIRTHSTYYYGSLITLDVPGVTWTEYNKEYTVNPNTTNAWTWDEIDALEAGVELKGYASAECTQVYVKIAYTAAGLENTVSFDIDAQKVLDDLTLTEADISDLGTTAALVSDKLSVFASTTSAELAGVISDETGSGALVFASSPSLVTPTISASRARAYLETTAQTITTSTATKLLLNAESYDNLGEFDSTTNYRFTATTAGYYAVSFSVLYVAATAAKTYSAYIYKNNSEVTRGQSQAATTGLNMIVNGSDIIYLNATNYLELFVWHNTGTDIDIYFGSPFTFMAVHRLS